MHNLIDCVEHRCPSWGTLETYDFKRTNQDGGSHCQIFALADERPLIMLAYVSDLHATGPAHGLEAVLNWHSSKQQQQVSI